MSLELRLVRNNTDFENSCSKKKKKKSMFVPEFSPQHTRFKAHSFHLEPCLPRPWAEGPSVKAVRSSRPDPQESGGRANTGLFVGAARLRDMKLPRSSGVTWTA